MPPVRTDRQTLTIEEVAVALGIDRSTAYELAKADRLPVPVIRLGRRLVVGKAALERVLSEHTYGHRAEQVDAILRERIR